jgi:hypothetical protein
MTIILGVFTELFVRGALVVPDNARATATNILAHESLYRLGLAAALVMLMCYIAVTHLFYDLFKPAGRRLSLLAAFISLVGIAVLAANSLNHLSPLVFLGGAPYLRAFETNQLQALVLVALRMHTRGYLISGVFFGVYMILLVYLIFSSGFLPRILGFLMAAGGFCFLTNSFVVFLSPGLAARLPDIGMLGGIAKLALSLWLMAMGVNVRKWEAKASSRQIAGA